ncbi:Uncharacterised protein [Streptococcus equi subsp. zooepidemicus]|uniref:Phage protein n=1 Tax=Streptococcus equi subsp. zooepidemicus TaxID=40041 RepID=A0AAX2LEL0_STRSZ|nr:hypothetical protein AT51_00506 [Streptococcus equi subsp. zooepidemicus Sz57]QTZ56124.1 hypothetical protein JFMEOBDD_00172 [Streptococcus equi subsp. zooepidemicus]QTZ58081.1 hypothetical protein MCPGFBBE_00180 [Streptococcus equi subsp. zooepidemicus]SQE95066.1 Uncharacterised protein [Streptococcus equi subsp. zooepidemicus]SUO80596.1 Uncharacterised protein [Streptococcus equi subsp. zooepidemicus]
MSIADNAYKELDKQVYRVELKRLKRLKKEL